MAGCRHRGLSERRLLRLLFVAGILVSLAVPAAFAAEIDFTRDIAPLFSGRCVQCHGESRREGGLRLTGRGDLLLLNDSGLAAVSPGQSQASELIRRVTAAEDSGERMPPEGAPLTPQQIDLLRRWVDAGAKWPDGAPAPRHWAYVKPVRPALPADADSEWCRHPIDRFVLARMQAAQLEPAAPAEPARLIRRLYLDLIGLPPSVEDVDAFLADPSAAHYARIVDRLLDSPRYGEKWARQWLDLARYADSNGYQADQFREIWAYRDWVIAAMNADMPFDQFTIEQFAGDLLPEATLDQRIATGFHRCTTCNVEAGVDPEENRVNQIIDRVNTTGTVWLGTTLECAQCHNHKYDPFTQQDYYQLFAFFNNTPLEVDQPSRGGVQYEVSGPKLALPLNTEQDRQRAELQGRRNELQQRAEARRQTVLAALPEWEQRFQSQSTAAPQWHQLANGEFTSAGGAQGERLEDGSILVTGERPDTDTYTLVFETPLTGITGFKLECLTHPSLSRSGPGRAAGSRPNFVAYELELSATPLRSTTVAQAGSARSPSETRVALHTATASFSQTNWDVAGLIDGDPKTGWAINPQFGKDHWASFLTSEPIGFEGGTRLTVRIPQTFGGARTIGRLRCSVMTGTPGATAIPSDLVAALKVPVEKRTARQRRKIAEYCTAQDSELAQLNRDLAAVDKQLSAIEPPTTLVMTEMNEPRLTRIFKRGDFLQPTATVIPQTPAALPPLDEQPAARARPDRLALAEWLVSPENPLTARVAVNRWWAEFFGRGIVATLEDFGAQGERPSHPELLDWLAVELMEHNWSMKHLHRQIVLSATYQQDSRVTPKSLQADPYNILLARGPRLRLSAETIRDQALTAAGLLSTRMGGPPVYPPQPANIWRHVGRNAPKYIIDTDEDRFRRGIYVVYRRSAPYPSFVTFDAPDRGASCVQRSRTNTPLQALTLLNDPAYVEAALGLARRIATLDTALDDRSRAEFGFRLVLSRPPTSAETTRLLELYGAARDRFSAQEAEAAALVPADMRLPDVPLADLAAWFYIGNLLLNLDETVTKG